MLVAELGIANGGTGVLARPACGDARRSTLTEKLRSRQHR
jgi:hypothetical protein